MNKFVAAAAVAAMSLTAAGGAGRQPGSGRRADLRRRRRRWPTSSARPRPSTCEFTRKGYKTEIYDGSIDKLGIDLGVTGGGKIVWLVFAASKDDVGKHSLAGNYVGASAEASLGLGVGGNWLIGGSKKSIALQPWSVTGTIGVNWSWTWTKLSLD